MNFLDSEKHFFGVWGKKFQQGCQNCILRVQRIILRLKNVNMFSPKRQITSKRIYLLKEWFSFKKKLKPKLIMIFWVYVLAIITMTTTHWSSPRRSEYPGIKGRTPPGTWKNGEQVDQEDFSFTLPQKKCSQRLANSELLTLGRTRKRTMTSRTSSSDNVKACKPPVSSKQAITETTRTSTIRSYSHAEPTQCQFRSQLATKCIQCDCCADRHRFRQCPIFRELLFLTELR